jgi:hypothetical protein
MSAIIFVKKTNLQLQKKYKIIKITNDLNSLNVEINLNFNNFF